MKICDNSARKSFNPDPTKNIRDGEPSDEEMSDGWIEDLEDKQLDAQAGERSKAGGAKLQ